MAKLNLQVIKSGGQFMPSTEYDAKKIEEYKEGQVFNLQPTGKRSNPHHNLYWATLKNVCEATNKWPTEQHLHSELKWACGYVKMRWNSLASAHMRIMDSISFDDMSQKEFNDYFDLAMEKLAEAIGYDPLEQSSK